MLATLYLDTYTTLHQSIVYMVYYQTVSVPNLSQFVLHTLVALCHWLWKLYCIFFVLTCVYLDFTHGKVLLVVELNDDVSSLGHAPQGLAHTSTNKSVRGGTHFKVFLLQIGLHLQRVLVGDAKVDVVQTLSCKMTFE